jgi:hypothetical protein
VGGGRERETCNRDSYIYHFVRGNTESARARERERERERE